MLPQTDHDYAQGFLTVQYLLGARGEQLGVPGLEASSPALSRQLEGLRSFDRSVRAEWLARGVGPLATALEARRWDAGLCG